MALAELRQQQPTFRLLEAEAKTSFENLTYLEIRQLLFQEASLVADFESVAEATYNFLLSYLDTNTGLPLDRVELSDDQELEAKPRTSPTNIGLALLSLGVVDELGWEDKFGSEIVESKLKQIVTSLSKMSRYQGLYLNWYNTKTGKALESWPDSNDCEFEPTVSAVDNAWLAVGLLYVREKFPFLTESIDEILSLMDFSKLYQKENNSFTGILYPRTSQFSEYSYDLGFLTETRIIYYVSYLLDQIGEAEFQRLTINFPEKTYGGSIFEALMVALVIDEGETADSIFIQLITSQIEAGADHGLWGFSPCDHAVDRVYKEFGIEAYGENGFEVITPHALFLSLRYAPTQTLSVLQKIIDQKMAWSKLGYGFYDSVSATEPASSQSWLYLDQAMIFLSLFNLLGDDSLRRFFSNKLKMKTSLE